MRNTIVVIVLTAVLCMVASADAALIWGVTGPSGVTTGGGEVFTIDTSTSTPTIDIICTYASTMSYGDIAVTPSGRLYVVGNINGSGWATGIAELNPDDGAIEWSGSTGVSFNSLVAESDTSLLAVQGGQSGAAANLYRLHLDENGHYTDKTLLGRIDTQSNSGGDITQTPVGSYIAAVNNGTDIFEILNVENPLTATKACDIAGIDWVGGLAYDYASGILYCGRYQTSTLYTLNLSTGATAAVAVTGDTLTKGIFGLASVPEPATLMFLGLGAALGVRCRRRR